jgi:DNA polymerase III sliding clamp (beta) subunit (PCNA family)
MTTDQLVIELNDPLSPGVIRPREDHDYFYVVMPMRV